jgi:hypothetical protein
MRPEGGLLAACLCLVLSACAGVGAVRPAQGSGPAIALDQDGDTAAAMMLANTIQTLQRLAQAGPAEQAEIIASSRAGFERAPMGSAQLQYALALSVPGTNGHDLERARMLLRELSAQPESLAPVARALLQVELAHVDRELALSADGQRLQSATARSDRERQAAASRRLQTEIDENAKLRKQLDEAQAKLDAIAQIERKLADRQAAAEGRKP